MPKSAIFEPLQPDQLPSACRLSSLAGWNQIEEDWRRLLHPELGRVGVWADNGEIRASYSVVHFSGRVAWIGMILVDPGYRGTGLGKAAFEASLACVRDLGIPVAGLDATDLGEPIYRKYGFEAVQPMVRWQGALQVAAAAPPSGSDATAWDAILRADRAASGVDRAPLLRALLESGARLVSITEPGGGSAFLFVRPGRCAWQLGPAVANCAASLPGLLAGAQQVIGRGSQAICDVPEGAVAASLLEAAGLSANRRLRRMTCPVAPGCLCGTGIRFAAGFELG